MANELNWLPATKLVTAYKKKKLSPVEVVRACLDQIARHDRALNAMSLIDEKSALKQAKASEARWHKGKPLGAVDGVPTLIKDLILVKGWPTLRGSRTVDRNQAWDHDGPSVARLREEGAVLIGMTTTPEFGWKGVTDSPLTGITRNPWDVSKTPGGSSGGSAAAVAAGYAPLALGTDGGGSIRIPAGFTGIFGLKPSFGRVPAWPLSPFGTVAHTGPMTRCVADAALMLNVIAKPDVRDWHSLPYDARDYSRTLGKGIKGLRIAFSPALGHAEVDPEVAHAVAKAVKMLRGLGARVDTVDPGFADPAAIFRVLWWSGARALLARMPEDKKALLDPGLADVVKQSLVDHAGRLFRCSEGARRAGRPDASVHAEIRSPGDAHAADSRLRSRQIVTGGRRRHRQMGELDAVQLSFQSHPAAGSERALRLHESGIADRTPHYRQDVR